MIHPAKVLSFACLVGLGVNFELVLAAVEPAIAQLEQTSPLPTSPDAAPYSPQSASPVGIGARGEEVEVLQRRLQDLGYYDGPIDGIYGSSTATGVENFQQDTSLPATGSVDLTTWQQLRSPLSAPASQSPAGSSLPEPVEVPGLTPESDSGAAVNDPENLAPVEADSPLAVEPLTPGDIEIDPEAVEAAPNPSGLWIGVAMLGLIAALIGVGVAIALWLRLRQLTAALDTDAAIPEAELRNSPSTTNGSLALSSDQASSEPLSRLSRIDILDELTADLQSSEPAIRHKAIWELGQRGHSAAVEPLVDIFLDADSKERSLILAALSEVGIHTLKPMNRALALSLQDANPEVRKNAIRDLTRLYELVAQVSQLLSHAAQDSSPEVQDTAQWAIGQLGQMRLMANPAINSPPELAPERQPDSPSQLS